MVESDGSIIVEGVANLRDLNKEMNWNLPTDGPKTVSGLIIETLGDIPQQPLCLRINGYAIEIIESGDNLVKQVRFLPPAKVKEKNNRHSQPRFKSSSH